MMNCLVEMMAPQTQTFLLLVYSSLFILSLQTSLTKPLCTPSACGIISKGDPNNCGDPSAELVCENNVTFLYLNSHKYYVKAINYTSTAELSFTSIRTSVRLVDASIENHTCSFPTHSSYHYIFSSNYASSPLNFMSSPSSSIYLMSCPHPLKNSSLFTDITHHCHTSNSSNPRFTYIKVGRMKASDVTESCSVDKIVTTSWEFENPNNVSLQEIHRSFLYGFEVEFKFCMDCRSPTAWALSSSIITIFGPRFITSVFLVWLLIYKFRRRHLSRFDTIENFLQSDNKLAPIRYSYSQIKKMTKNFQDILGEGGYGSVYKGKLISGQHVAVKLLGKSGANDQDFMNEIATIGRIHHVNIVTLVGYCVEGSKRALVIDFMPNGSLEKYIFNQEKMNSLNWDTKFEIVVGIARGIEYLHQGCDIQILHFDIKPHNILLDGRFIPKVSDFGLSKFCSAENNTMTITAARGTIGYVALELINRGIGRISYKADVYSFGMLLMELVGLKGDLRGNNNDSSKYFPGWIYDHINQDKDIKMEGVDENGNNYENEITRALVRKMTIVALWCIQMNPDDRPSINKVLEMLEGEVEHLQIPQYPLVNENERWEISSSIYSDSASLLHYKDAPSLEITVED